MTASSIATAATGALVLGTGVLAILFVEPTTNPVDFRDFWRGMPALVGSIDVGIGAALIVLACRPGWIFDADSRVTWKGGAYGAKPPPGAGFDWNPWTLFLTGLCIGSILIAEVSILYLIPTSLQLSEFISAGVAVVHLGAVFVLWRTTRRVISAAA